MSSMLQVPIFGVNDEVSYLHPLLITAIRIGLSNLVKRSPVSVYIGSVRLNVNNRN